MILENVTARFVLKTNQPGDVVLITDSVQVTLAAFGLKDSVQIDFRGRQGYNLTNNQIILAWTASTSLDTIGYKVYWGTTSGLYTQSQDVGNVTQTTLVGLFQPNVTYYFVVTAYSAGLFESPPSNEISSVPYFTLLFGGTSPASHKNRHDYIPTGTMTLSGTAGIARRHVYTPTGTILMGGQALTSSKGGGRFTYVGSGSLFTSGSASRVRTTVATVDPSTPIRMSGTSSYSLSSARQIFSITGSGLMTFGGTSPLSITHVPPTTGSLIMGGTSNSTFVPVIIPPVHYSYSGGGTIVTGGTSPVSARHVPVGSGSLITGGQANYHFSPASATSTTWSYSGVGILNMGGSSSISVDHVPVGSGTLTMGGTSHSHYVSNSPSPVSYSYIGTGIILMGGSSTNQRTIVREGSGTMTLSGSGDPFIRHFGGGSTVYTPVTGGTIIMGGTYGLVIVRAYESSGGIVMGGDAGVQINATPITQFRLYKRDCEVRVKEHGTNAAYSITNPFGGPHHDEPSGAEI